MTTIKKFLPSPNKELVRNEIDTPIVTLECAEKNRKLSYFGLPSEGLFDIKKWNAQLYRYDAVEKGEDQHKSITQHLVMLGAFQNEMNSEMNLLRGDVNDILINGHDDDGQLPRFPFDIVNLDYYGGILHEGTKKVKAITRLVERQDGANFTLFMTFDVMEDDSSEKIKTLDSIEKLLIQFSPEKKAAIHDYVQEHKSKSIPDSYRQKVYVPYFVRGIAETRQYKVFFHEPVFYEGSNGAPMMHFVCRLTFERGTTTSAVSEQSLLDVLNLRMLEVKGGIISYSRLALPTI